MKPELQAQITQLGLDYRLMTQFTSFVAVEDRIVTKDGKPQRVEVPVEMPEGVSHEGVFGEQKQYAWSQGGMVGGMMMSSNQTSFLVRSPAQIQVGSASETIEVDNSAPQIVLGAMPTPTPPPSPLKTPAAKTTPKSGEPAHAAQDRERRSMERKLQPAVLSALDCSRQGTKTAAPCANVQAGKIALEVWLTADSAALREQLRALGFELKRDHGAQKMLAGNLAVDKLEALARLDAVQFVSLERR